MEASHIETLEQPAREEILIDAVLQALADPVRLRLVRKLADHTEPSTGVACGQIPLPVSKSTRTHHLRTLREAGVISIRVDGTRRIAWLRSEDLNARFPGLLDSLHTAG